MSGPKIIEVVSVEEAIAECRTHLADIDAAIKEWVRVAARNNIDSAPNQDRLQSKRTEILRLLNAGNYLAVQKQAPEVVEWIEQDLSELVEQQYMQQYAKQSKRRGLQQAAMSVMANCRSAKISLSEEVAHTLANAGSDEQTSNDQLQSAISVAMHALADADCRTKSERQQELVGEIGKIGESLSLDEWLARVADDDKDERLAKVEQQIAQLAGVESGEIISRFSSRLDAIRIAPTQVARNMLIESISVDLAAARKEASVLVGVRRALIHEKADAETVGDFELHRQAFESIEASFETRNLKHAAEQLEQLKQARLAQKKERNARAGRTAILQGLRELGYEVREGMSTSWALQKRLTIRNKAKPGVALELAGNAIDGRIQARMVAVQGLSRNPQSDKQVEEQWCNELDSLQRQLTAGGSNLAIVKAVAAGVHPLKIVPNQWETEDDQIQSPRERHQ